MFTKYAERYVLRTPSTGMYLCVTDQDAQIRSSDTPDNAWIFTPMRVPSPMLSGSVKCTARRRMW